MPIYRRAQCIYTVRYSLTPRGKFPSTIWHVFKLNRKWHVGGNLGKTCPVPHTESNLSSGLSRGPWSYEATMLPTGQHYAKLNLKKIKSPNLNKIELKTHLNTNGECTACVYFQSMLLMLKVDKMSYFVSSSLFPASVK